jgi:hypothetical protein
MAECHHTQRPPTVNAQAAFVSAPTCQPGYRIALISRHGEVLAVCPRAMPAREAQDLLDVAAPALLPPGHAFNPLRESDPDREQGDCFGVLLLDCLNGWKPNSAKSVPPAHAHGLTLELATAVAEALNLKAIQKANAQWFSVAWQGGTSYGVVLTHQQGVIQPSDPRALPSVMHAIGLAQRDAGMTAAELNKVIYKHAVLPRTWAVVVRDMRAGAVEGGAR